jgi:hypothetical protein
MAVGMSVSDPGTAQTYATLAAVWNGVRWSVVPMPSVGPSNLPYLNGISCLSPTWCMAVGQDINSQDDPSILTEMWNGSSWSLVPAPNVSPGQLNAVSCVKDHPGNSTELRTHRQVTRNSTAFPA